MDETLNRANRAGKTTGIPHAGFIMLGCTGTLWDKLSIALVSTPYAMI